MRTVDDVLASFPAGSVTMLPAGDVAMLVAEVERLRGLIDAADAIFHRYVADESILADAYSWLRNRRFIKQSPAA